MVSSTRRPLRLLPPRRLRLPQTQVLQWRKRRTRPLSRPARNRQPRAGGGQGGAQRQRQAGGGRRRRNLFDPRQRRESRPADQSGGRTGDHPGDAGADRVAGGSGDLRNAPQRHGAARAQHARPAGIGDVDPHDADQFRVQPLPARGARSGGQARQAGRTEDRRRGHRTRQGADREDRRSADPSGAQQPRSRHRVAREARRRRQAGHGHHHAARIPPGRQHRHRSGRRRRRPEPRKDPRQGAENAAWRCTTPCPTRRSGS